MLSTYSTGSSTSATTSTTAQPPFFFSRGLSVMGLTHGDPNGPGRAAGERAASCGILTPRSRKRLEYRRGREPVQVAGGAGQEGHQAATRSRLQLAARKSVREGKR